MGRGCSCKSLSNKSRAAGPIVQVKLSIRSAIKEISPLIDRLMLLIKESNCVVGEEINVEIALREAVTNAVLHGNKADPEKRVTICCEVGLGSGVSVIVRDEGQGFDAANVSDPTTTENIECNHGRGIYLMRAVMDEVHFEQGGTEVHMRKGFKHITW
jgi:serine/threonine-protein kinase RsbW